MPPKGKTQQAIFFWPCGQDPGFLTPRNPHRSISWTAHTTTTVKKAQQEKQVTVESFNHSAIEGLLSYCITSSSYTHKNRLQRIIKTAQKSYRPSSHPFSKSQINTIWAGVEKVITCWFIRFYTCVNTFLCVFVLHPGDTTPVSCNDSKGSELKGELSNHRLPGLRRLTRQTGV